jgi:hypothetical protein
MSTHLAVVSQSAGDLKCLQLGIRENKLFWAPDVAQRTSSQREHFPIALTRQARGDRLVTAVDRRCRKLWPSPLYLRRPPQRRISQPFLCQWGYEALLAPFSVEDNNNPTPSAVRQLIAAATNQHLPVALMALVDGRLTPFFPSFWRKRAMGVAKHPTTDGRMFTFDGELIG